MTTTKQYMCNTCLTETDQPGRHCTGTAIADHDAARVTAARRLAELAPRSHDEIDPRLSRFLVEHRAHLINRKVDAIVSVGLPLTPDQIADILIEHVE